MDHSEICKRILNIISDALHINTQHISSEHYNAMLTSSTWGLSEIDMTYLFFEVEKEFNIQISAEALLNYEFSTINGIATLIAKEQENVVFDKKRRQSK